MKLSLSIKILTIFFILQQISCAVPTGMELAKNLTRTTFQGVFNLGKFSTGGSITVKSLVGEIVSLTLYQKTIDAQSGVFTGTKGNSTISFAALETKTITLSAST